MGATHPEIDLIVRLHPAEVGLLNHPTLERMADRIAGIPVLPANVRVIPAEDPTSSYVFMEEARSASSTRRRWVSSLPPAASRSWSRRMRITADGASPRPGHRDRVLGGCRAPAGIPTGRSGAPTHSRACASVCRGVLFPLPSVLAAVTEDGRSRPRIRVDSAADLDPGWDPPMDRVVPGILDGIAPIAPLGAESQVIVSN